MTQGRVAQQHQLGFRAAVYCVTAQLWCLCNLFGEAVSENQIPEEDGTVVLEVRLPMPALLLDAKFTLDASKMPNAGINRQVDCGYNKSRLSVRMFVCKW